MILEGTDKFILSTGTSGQKAVGESFLKGSETQQILLFVRLSDLLLCPRARQQLLFCCVNLRFSNRKKKKIPAAFS